VGTQGERESRPSRPTSPVVTTMPVTYIYMTDTCASTLCDCGDAVQTAVNIEFWIAMGSCRSVHHHLPSFVRPIWIYRKHADSGLASRVAWKSASVRFWGGESGTRCGS
jgi:hypothetical protein